MKHHGAIRERNRSAATGRTLRGIQAGQAALVHLLREVWGALTTDVALIFPPPSAGTGVLSARAGCAIGTMTMIGHPLVCGTQQESHAGQLCRGMNRPRPPDFCCQKRDCLCSTQDLAFGRENPHFLQQEVGRQTEKCRHPRILQRRQAKATLLQGGAEAARQGAAEIALAIVENPSGGSPSLSIGYF